MLNAETDLIANKSEFVALGATDERYSAIDPLPGKALSEIANDAKVLIFVHGMNVNLNAAKKWFDESFKRLYWTGYKGEFIGVHWNGADAAPALFGGPPLAYNSNIYHAFQTGSTLATWFQTIAANREISVMTHSAGGVATLEALRLINATSSGSKKIKNLITTQAATFNNVFSPSLGTVDGTPGTFDNLSWNNWFSTSLNMVSGKYENFYSENDKTLWLTLANLNENVGIGKFLGHASDSDARRDLQLIERTAKRLAFTIPGTHSFGPDSDFGVKCVVPHNTAPLGSHPAPFVVNVDCEPAGFGLYDSINPAFSRNQAAGSHSFMRETNYDETFRLFRRIYEVTK